MGLGNCNQRIANQIIVALDGITEKEALTIASHLKGMVWGFKVTDLLFGNTQLIRELKKSGKVFADAKLYDIPNTVDNSVRRLSRMGADLITVHASGGIEMMKAAKAAAGRTKIAGVTVLTSLGGPAAQVKQSVIELAQQALLADLDAIICSGQELEVLKSDESFIQLLKIVPGIRPSWFKENDDQKRTVTPSEAVCRGADMLVIGRPVIRSKDPVKVVEKILVELRDNHS